MKRTLVLLKCLVVMFLMYQMTGFYDCDCDRQDPEEEEDDPTSRAWAQLDPHIINFGAVIVGQADTALIYSTRQSRYGDIIPYAYNVAVMRNFPDFYFPGGAAAGSLFTDTLTVADPATDFPVVFAPQEIGIFSSAARTRSPVVVMTDTVHLEGIGVEGCAFSRNRIDFGDVDVGESRLDTFTVRNITAPSGGYDVTIQVDIINCEFLKFVINGSPTHDTRQWTLGAGEAAVCTLQFTPPGTGDHACPLETGNESYCGPIFVTGTGAGSSLGDWETCRTDAGPDLYGVHGDYFGSAYAVGDSGTVLVHGTIGPICNWNTGITTGIDTLSFRGISVVAAGYYWIAGSEIGDAWGGAHVFGRALGRWVQQDSIVTIEHYNCGWASSDNDIYFFGLGAVSDHNGRHFDGATWENALVDFGMSEVTGIWGSGPNDVWAVMNQSSNNVWHYDGSTWENRSEVWMDENPQDVWVDAGGDVFVVGTNGAIYYYDGSAWANHTIFGGVPTLYGVSGNSPSDVHAVGAAAALLHYDGFSWRTYTPPAGVTADLRDVWVNHLGEAWAVGQRGTILYHPGP